MQLLRKSMNLLQELELLEIVAQEFARIQTSFSLTLFNEPKKVINDPSMCCCDKDSGVIKGSFQSCVLNVDQFYSFATKHFLQTYFL